MAAFTSWSVTSNCETIFVVSASRAMVRGREVGATVGKGAGFWHTGSWERSVVEEGNKARMTLYESSRCRASWRSLELCGGGVCVSAQR